MRTIIAGSQDIEDYVAVEEAIRLSGFNITEVVSGGAKGVDRLGELWAFYKKIPIRLFEVTKADWIKKGRAAGPIRNSEMAKYPDALIAVWDGKSPGTADMIKKAKAKGLSMYVHQYTLPKETE